MNASDIATATPNVLCEIFINEERSVDMHQLFFLNIDQ
jgi:hypothetical protein